MTGEAGAEQLEAVVRLVSDALRTELIGIYLHGSSVLGGAKPASDLDLLAVTRRTLDDRQRRSLVTGLMAVSGSRVGERPVELTVVVESDVRPWRWPPTGDFQYGEWLRAQYEAGQLPQSESMPELALTIAVTLAGDQPLVGPPPAQVLDPVPAPDLTRASLDGIPALLEDLPGDTRNVVLTLARIWSTLATGTIRSKDAAADWALKRLDPQHRPVLAHARRLYLESTYHEETWSDELRAQVPSHVDEVLAHIGRLTPQSR
jgi:streptomycin 3"-adenylyltransferase